MSSASTDRGRSTRRDSWASSQATRHVMKGNRGRDTKPELAVRRAAHALGLRYRTSARPLQNVRRTADMVFVREKVAVYIDGCFWHGCPHHYVASKTNASFWDAKIHTTRQRDTETDQLLRQAGWTPIRIWEHDDPQTAAETIRRVIEERRRELAGAAQRRSKITDVR